jgi:hypothetical protein
MDSAAILSDLALSLPYAKRVHQDCSTIISVVTSIDERWHSLSHTQQSNYGWSYATGMIPPKIVESFPYQSLNPPLQGAVSFGDDSLEGLADVRGNGPGILWLF